MAYSAKELSAMGNLIDRSRYRRCSTCGLFYFIMVYKRHAKACSKKARVAREQSEKAFKARIKEQ